MSKQKTERYRFSVTNDYSHEMLWSFKATKLGLTLIILSVIVIGLIAFFCIFAYTPAKTFIPGYPDARSRREAVRNAITVDSLETVIARWELYTENLKNVIEGKEALKLDSLVAKAGNSQKSAEEYAKYDSLLRKTVTQEEQFQLSEGKKGGNTIEGMHFFSPVKGTVSVPYDEILHPYVDVTVTSNTAVKAALEGTVIEAYWSDEYGYSIVLQHENGIISIYRHNNKVSKKVGDKVSAGTAIGFIDSSQQSPKHLHFELWYKGEYVNPEAYINF